MSDLSLKINRVLTGLIAEWSETQNVTPAEGQGSIGVIDHENIEIV